MCNFSARSPNLNEQNMYHTRYSSTTLYQNISTFYSLKFNQNDSYISVHIGVYVRLGTTTQNLVSIDLWAHPLAM